MGYIGGSTIPFLISIGTCAMGLSNPAAVKLCVVLTSVWWGIFSIPMLKTVKQKYYIEKRRQHVGLRCVPQYRLHLRDIFKNKGFLFMIAYFFI